jgi:hypothetical protein
MIDKKPGSGRHGSVPQKYRHNDTGEVVKTERVSTQKIVIEFNDGTAERVSEGELRRNYTHLGEWHEYSTESNQARRESNQDSHLHS